MSESRGLPEPERLRWMLIADQTRKVEKDGIHFEAGAFIAPALTRIGGMTDGVGYMPHDLRLIEVRIAPLTATGS